MHLFHYHLVTSRVREVEARYIGKLGFDAKGDLTSSTYVWYQFKDGKYAEAPGM